MKKPSRTPLNSWQIADSERLRAIYLRRVKESKARGDRPVLNQAEVGERCDWKSPQSAFSQYMNGKVALNLDALVRLAKALSVHPTEISPTLSELLPDTRAHGSDRAQIAGHRQEAANTPLPAGGEQSIDLDDRYAFIPQYDAKAAAGLGRENPHVEIRSTLAFKREWLKVKGVKPDNLIVIYAAGHSMWPTIDDGDVLLVDRSRIEPADGHVFVLAAGDKTLVKRLVKATGERWVIRSDNEDKKLYGDLEFADSEDNEHRIVGRVVWRGGDL